MKIQKKEIVDIIKKILDFNKQQNGKGYSLYREKEVAKKYKQYIEFNKVIKQNWYTIKSYYILHIDIYIDPHRLLVNLPHKTNLKWSDKYVALSNLSIYYTWKNIKKWYKSIKLKISAPTWN